MFRQLQRLFPNTRVHVQTCNYFLVGHHAFNVDRTLRLTNRYDWDDYQRLFNPARFQIRAFFRRELLVGYQLHTYMKNRYFDRVVYAYLSGCLFGDP